MKRILTITLFSLAAIVAATSAEARRALIDNGTSVAGVPSSSPVVILSVELP